MPMTNRYQSFRAGQTALTERRQILRGQLPHPEKTMHKIIAASALGLILALSGAGAADARGWQRQSTTIGPKGGTTTHSASGSCSGGTCTRQGSTTGPRGNSVSSQGSASCADGHCASSGTATGPRGGTVNRSGSSSYTPPN